MHRFVITVGAGIAALTSVASAQDGGAAIIERGTPDMGASGAGNMARAEDAGTAHFNAAGMTRLKQREFLGGLVGIYADLSIDLDDGTRSTPPGNRNGGGAAGGFAPAAGMYLAMPIEDDLWFGFTFNGLYGGSVDYYDDWAGRTFVTEASLTGLNVEPALGYKLDEHWSFGGSVSAVYTTLEVKFKAAPPEGAPTLKVDDADDWGFGYSLSALYEHDEDTRIGARYRSKVDVDLDGDFGARGTAFDFDADLEMPQSVAVGAYHALDDKWALLGDVSWTDWSVFSYIPATLGTGAGKTVPIDRDWDDVWRIGAGAQYQWSEATVLRTGIAWTGDVVSDRRRLPDIPVGETWRFSLGLETELSESTTLGLSYTLAWMPDMKLDNVDLPPQFNSSLKGEFDDAAIHFIGLTLRYQF